MPNIFNTARYILHTLGPTSCWKLQKLCYYCQAWSLAWTGKSLFPEDFEAWSNGPVCPRLYQVHHGIFIVSVDDIPEYLESTPFLTEEQKETIESVLDTYGDWMPYELREETHTELPWQEARGDLPVGAPCTTVIAKTAMASYYAAR